MYPPENSTPEEHKTSFAPPLEIHPRNTGSTGQNTSRTRNPLLALIQKCRKSGDSPLIAEFHQIPDALQKQLFLSGQS